MSLNPIDSKFQSFSAQSEKPNIKNRLKKLREQMSALKIDAFMVPRGDEFRGEYVPPCSERLAYITGFTGSAGFAIITQDQAALFIDGRYTVQARNQVDPTDFEHCDLIDQPPTKWLSQNLSTNATLGFDPNLHSIFEIKALKEALFEKSTRFQSLPLNPIDSIWTDQPAVPLQKITIQELERAGELALDKLSKLQGDIQNRHGDYYLINDTTAISWAFNIRGNDVPHTPTALCFAILAGDGNHKIFINFDKLNIETRAYLTQICDIMPLEAMDDFIQSEAQNGAKFLGDTKLLGQKFAELVKAGKHEIAACDDLISLPRAKKNPIEIEGARAAHLRDGVAMAKFLHWFDDANINDLDEITIAKKLENFREKTGEQFQMPLLDISFDTISGSGPHAALPHYRVNEETNRALKLNEIYLIDSGGQYQDGTTDITRTLCKGRPSDEMKRHFTLVLKGHIAINQLRFPKNTCGAQIDVLARHALWQAGYDFNHGTGHGVGSYLSVHEGPQGIHKRASTPFEAGMIVSNEPGYYLENHYGIRIENLIVVHEPKEIEGGEIKMMGFEILSYTPIEKALVNKTLLTENEIDWLNAYHQSCYEHLSPHLKGDELSWLKEACAKI